MAKSKDQATEHTGTPETSDHTLPEEAVQQEDTKNEDLNSTIEALTAKLEEMQNLYLRKSADFDNYRKRMIKEKQEAIDYANANLIFDIIQIIDNFERALDLAKNGTENTASFMEGMAMIYNQLSGLLTEKYHLSSYESKNSPFDPNVHEAVAMHPSQEVSEPTVGEELQKGYMLKDRILRHARVTVLMPEKKACEEKTDVSPENEDTKDSHEKIEQDSNN